MRYQIVIAAYPAHDSNLIRERKNRLSELVQVHVKKDGQYAYLVSEEMGSKELKAIQKKLKSSGIRYTVKNIEEEE